MTETSWIAVDWGTSNVRAWGLSADNKQVFSATGARGMGTLGPAEYPAALLELLGDHAEGLGEGTPVIVCGMAGARQGWREAPYLEVPAALADIARTAARPDMADARLAPRILPGLCQRGAAGENVMRGEETQLFGLSALKPGFSGVVCVPGTHSKWVRLAEGRCLGFETAMTGELYEVLRHHSILRHSLPGDLEGPEREQGVSAGMDAGLGAPERLTSLLFRTRAASLLSDRGPDWCGGYLSGLLVGAEVAAYRSWRGTVPVVLIGSERLCRLYAAAIIRDGGESEIVDATEVTLSGLIAAREHGND